ncbi:unnamed protein product [Phaedon cochleariae]|uniref:LIM zinc-binding domain-containing protein n=1 Tax=Phaedon cochleariae TaxID=80249 RepID=A0A9P0DF04_PHACE|nr:unnamed protein product [Phaedon cochleariae]
MTCARCGCGVYEAENQITLNKIWHKCCFCCRNCNTKLDKCTAKIFQGEIYCQCCYENIVEDLEKLSPTPYCRPCRVVSSPSCICLRKEDNRENIPSFDYCKKYNICFQPEENKARRTKTSQSCSCLIDIKKNNQSYCFAFPIPREVANYYNRANMRKNKGQYSKAPNCCPKDDPFHTPRRTTRIRVRDISPPQRKCPSPPRRRSPSPKPRRRCCCSRCRPPAASPPPSCPADRPPSCSAGCKVSYSADQPPSCPPCRPPSCPPCRPPPCPNAPCCTCCMPKPSSRCRSPPRRHPSPPRRCPPAPCPEPYSCPPDPCSCSKRQQDCPPKKPQQCCCNDGAAARDSSRQADCAGVCCCKEKTAKYCVCGRQNPCNCKMSQIRAVCTSVCMRCGHKVYAAEKISVSSGPYHNSCFSCYCCHKLLDVRNVYENCDEIYCKNCYNNFFGISYYGYGSSQYC